MVGYWVRHRLLLTVIFCVTVAAVAGLLFAFPYITQQAGEYNSQSIYKNSEMDFIAPEPSYEQVAELAGSNGIDAVFPFYLTKTQISVNGKSRTTTILLSDQFQNVNITMYNDNRLIEKAETKFENSVLVDWQFCKETGANVGDVISFTINGVAVEYSIYAIYETNTIYDGGAILAEISAEQATAIKQNSKNGGYSGMYIAASDYDACRIYMTNDYRPLGRLKTRDSFESDEQYQIHYDAIMSAGYANEITDFRVREKTTEAAERSALIYIGALLVAVLSVAFNIVLAKRGCERNYFAKHCVPKGKNVKPFYGISFIVEILLMIAAFIASVLVMLNDADMFIPAMAVSSNLVAIPGAMLAAGLVNIFVNNSRIKKLISATKNKH